LKKLNKPGYGQLCILDSAEAPSEQHEKPMKPQAYGQSKEMIG
jgi:hypothetical protein